MPDDIVLLSGEVVGCIDFFAAGDSVSRSILTALHRQYGDRALVDIFESGLIGRQIAELYAESGSIVHFYSGIRKIIGMNGPLEKVENPFIHELKTLKTERDIMEAELKVMKVKRGSVVIFNSGEYFDLED